MNGGRRSWVGLGLALLLVLVYAYIAWPTVKKGFIPGPSPDAPDYVHLAESILHGSVLVDYDGPPRLTRYTPGFSILMAPAVAIGGLEAAVWVPYVGALVLGMMAALLAWRVGGGLAAPIATLLTLFSVGVYMMAHLIMSDLPSAAITLAEVALLVLAVGARSAVFAGLLAGLLVWIRPGSLVLVAAGVAGLSASTSQKRRLVGYLAGLLVPLALLAVWQWSVFGSPFVTSYQATGASGSGASDLEAFLSITYVFGAPWNSYAVGTEPNGLVYPPALIGFDNDLTYPGVGLLGLIGAFVLARLNGGPGILGRFTLVANVVTLCLYLPYFYRDVRFLMIPVALNDVTAAIVLARGLSAFRTMLSIPRTNRSPGS